MPMDNSTFLAQLWQIGQASTEASLKDFHLINSNSFNQNLFFNKVNNEGFVLIIKRNGLLELRLNVDFKFPIKTFDSKVCYDQ